MCENCGSLLQYVLFAPSMGLSETIGFDPVFPQEALSPETRVTDGALEVTTSALPTISSAAHP